MIFKKHLSIEETLEYIAFAVWHKDLSENFEGEITCDMNYDGSIEVYTSCEDKDKDKDKELN